eukprot:CAMPEP_0197032838 /NCGR_PEP_ID=MMETSP1384-20130603/11399_1 /TAXON_ID=29189 /ORGANISM="Ammonia sp." /LENGTH=346 /DNA_ID=CAMNT_0042462551 /DNA_START=67 /DNA_END=1107 /DNA_ORIENTATION=-
MACAAIPVLTWTCYRYYIEHKQQTLSSPKYLYRSCMAFFIICLIYMASLLFANIFKCHTGYSLYKIIGQITGLTYVIHWGLLIAIYLSRLTFVFRGTVLAIPKSHIWCFVGLSVLFIFLSIIVQLAVLQMNIHVLLILGYILAFGTAATINTVLFSMFLHKLCQLIRMTSNIGDKQQILDIMSKYTVLNLFTSLTTLMFLFALCLMMAYPHKPILIEIANMLNVVDTYTDVLCMTLSFSFAKTGYNRLCRFCDNQLVNVCDGGRQQQSLQVNLESQVQQNQQRHDGETQPEKPAEQESKSHQSHAVEIEAIVSVPTLSVVSDDSLVVNENKVVEGTTAAGLQFTIS